MGFSRQEYWRWLWFPSPRALPDPGIQPGLLHWGGFFTIWATICVLSLFFYLFVSEEWEWGTFPTSSHFSFFKVQFTFSKKSTGCMVLEWLWGDTPHPRAEKPPHESRHGTQIGSKSRKEYLKAIYCHPANYLTYMQSTSWEMLGWTKYKLESKLPGEISITSDMQMTYM